MSQPATDRCSNIWSTPAPGYVSLDIATGSLIATKEAGGTSERLTKRSRVTLFWPGYLHHRLACHGLLIITVINAITWQSPARQNARELKLANAAIIDMRRCVTYVALDAKYTKELADVKAENDALRDDVAAGRRRLHIKAVCQSVREATTASGVDNAASPDCVIIERDYFTPERG